MTLFQPWEKAETRQVIDAFENHFLKSVFRTVAGKNLPKAIDPHAHHENRRDALRAALNVFNEVRQKGLADNPNDEARIIEAGNKAIDRAIGSFERLPDVESDTRDTMTKKYLDAKMGMS